MTDLRTADLARESLTAGTAQTRLAGVAREVLVATTATQTRLSDLARETLTVAIATIRVGLIVRESLVAGGAGGPRQTAVTVVA